MGSVLGAVAGGTIGGAGGTLVVPGVGTITGAGSGVVVGAGAGAFFGSAIGAGLGIGAGINHCNEDDPCDTYPRAVPQPTPKADPMPPPPPGGGGRDCATAYGACLGWANQGSSPWEQRMRRGLCSDAYKRCKELDITVKFPDGSVVR